MPGGAVGVGIVGQGSQIVPDWSHARLIRTAALVRAIHVRTSKCNRAAITVVRVPIIGSRDRVWVFDLIARRSRRITTGVGEVAQVGRAQENEVSAGPT